MRYSASSDDSNTQPSLSTTSPDLLISTTSFLKVLSEKGIRWLHSYPPSNIHTTDTYKITMYFSMLTSTLLLLSTLHTATASSRSAASAPRQYQPRDTLAYLEGEANMLYRRDSDEKICDMSKAAMPDGE